MSYCKFCHQKGLKLLFEANKKSQPATPAAFACTNCGFGRHGKIVECHDCGLIYSDDIISQSQISTYYEVAKDSLYFAEQNARKKTFNHYLNRLEKIFPKKGKLLDIGTNTGLFVRLARDRGWGAIGLEPNRLAVEFAKKNYDIDLVAEAFEKNSFPGESFEVVTMWDVIEHFNDPVSEIKKVYYQLKPSGLFAFSTVDPKSLFARTMGSKWSWYMDMHRTFFTRDTAKKYLFKIGFRKIIFNSHWRYLSLGYLSSRLLAINPTLASVSSAVVKLLGLPKSVVPYYANDLFDCYAFKP